MSQRKIFDAVDAAHERFTRFGALARACERVGHDLKSVIGDQLSRILDDAAGLADIRNELELSSAVDSATADALDDDAESLHIALSMLEDALRCWDGEEGNGAVADRLRSVAAEGALLCSRLNKAASMSPGQDRRKAQDPSYKGSERRGKDRRKSKRS